MANSADYKITVKVDSTQVAQVKRDIAELQQEISKGKKLDLKIDIDSLQELLQTIDKSRNANHQKFLGVTNLAEKSQTDLSSFIPDRAKYVQDNEAQRDAIKGLQGGLSEAKKKGFTHLTEDFIRQVTEVSSEVFKTDRALASADNILKGSTKNIHQDITNKIKMLNVDEYLKSALDDKHKKLIQDANLSGSKQELGNFVSLLSNADKQLNYNTEDLAKVEALGNVDKTAFRGLIYKSNEDTKARLLDYADEDKFQNPKAVRHKKEVERIQKQEGAINDRITRFLKSVDNELANISTTTKKFETVEDTKITAHMAKIQKNQNKLGSYNRGNLDSSNIDRVESELVDIVLNTDSVKKELVKDYEEYIRNNKEGLQSVFEDAKQNHTKAINDLRKLIKGGKLSLEDRTSAEDLKRVLETQRESLKKDAEKLRNKNFTAKDAEKLRNNPYLHTEDAFEKVSALQGAYKNKKPPTDTFEELLAKKYAELEELKAKAGAMARNTYKNSDDFRYRFYRKDLSRVHYEDTEEGFAEDLQDAITSESALRLDAFKEKHSTATTKAEKQAIYEDMKYAQTRASAQRNLTNIEQEILHGTPLYRKHIMNGLNGKLKHAISYKKSLEKYKENENLGVESQEEISELIEDVKQDIMNYSRMFESSKTADEKKLKELSEVFDIKEQRKFDEDRFEKELSLNKGTTKDFNAILRTSKTAINSGIGEATKETESNYETTKSYKVDKNGNLLDKAQYGDRIKKLIIGNAQETVDSIEAEFKEALANKDFGKIKQLTSQLQDLGLSKIIPQNVKTIKTHLKEDLGIEGVIKHTQKNYQELHKKIGEDIKETEKSDLPEKIKKQKVAVLKEFQKSIGKELQNITKVAKDVAGQDISTDAGAKKLGQIANNIQNSTKTQKRIENDYNKFDGLSSADLNTADLEDYYEKQSKVLKNTYKFSSELEQSREALDKQTNSMKAQNKVSQDMEKEVQRLITLETQYSRTIKARESYATSASIEQARKEQAEIQKQREALEEQRDKYNNMSVLDRGRASNDMSAQVANSRAGAFNQQNAYGQSRADLGELTMGNRFKRIAENTAMFSLFTGAVALATGAVVALGKEFIEFDKNVAMMTALLGDGNKSVAETRKEMEQLELKLMDLGTVYGGTFEEINQSALQLGRAGIQLEHLSKATETALKLTKLTGGTMESSTAVLVSFITTYGKASATIESSQANVKEIGDSLAYWSRMARGSMEDLNTFSTYALEASANAGLTTTATLALGASFNNLGMSASTAGTTTRTLMNSLGDTNPEIVAFYEKIGFSQDAMAGKFRKGGKESEQALIQLSKRLNDISKKDFSQLTKGLDTYDKHAMTSLRSASNRIEAYIKDARKVQNELDKAKIATDNLASSWEKLVNNIKLSFHGIADWIGKIAKGMIDAINATYDEAEKRGKRLQLMTPEEQEKNDPRRQFSWEDKAEALDIVTGNSTGVPEIGQRFDIDKQVIKTAKAVAEAIYTNNGQHAVNTLLKVKDNIDRTKMLTTEDYGNLGSVVNHLQGGAGDSIKAKDALLLTPESIAEIKKMQVTLLSIDKKLESPKADIKLQGAKDLYNLMGHTLTGATNSAVAVQEMAEQATQKFAKEGSSKRYIDDYNQIKYSANQQKKNKYSWDYGNDCSALGSSFMASRGINTMGEGKGVGIGTTTASHLTYMNKHQLNLAQSYNNMTMVEAKKAGMKFVEGMLVIVKNPKIKGRKQSFHEGVVLEDGTIAHFGATQNIGNKNFATNGARLVGVMNIGDIQEEQGVGNISALNSVYYSRPELLKNKGNLVGKPSDEGYKPLFKTTDISAMEKFNVNSKSTYKKEIKSLDKEHYQLLQDILTKLTNIMEGGSFESNDKNISFAKDIVTKIKGITKKANSKVVDVEKHTEASEAIATLQTSIDNNQLEGGDASITGILTELVKETKAYQDDLVKVTEARQAVRDLLKKDATKDKIKELQEIKIGKLKALNFVTGNAKIDKIKHPEEYAESRDTAIKEKEISINKEYIEQLNKLQQAEQKRITALNKQIDGMVTSGSLDKKMAEDFKKELQERSTTLDSAKNERTTSQKDVDTIKQEIKEYQAEATYQTNQLFRNFAEQAELASRESFKFMFSEATPKSKTEALERKGVADKQSNDEMLYNVSQGRINRFDPVVIDMDVSESSMSGALDYLNEEFADTWIGRQMRNMSINTDGLDEWADSFMNSAVSQIGRHEIFIKYKQLSDTEIAKDKAIFKTKDNMAKEASDSGNTNLSTAIQNTNIAGSDADFEASISQARIDRQTEEYAQLLELHRQHLESKKTQEEFHAEQDKEMKTKAIANNLEMASNAFSAMGDIASLFRNKEGKLTKKAFEAQKAFNIGQAIMKTAVGVTEAWSLPPPMDMIKIAMVVASGMAQVATIKQQTYHTGGAVSNDGFSNTRSDEVPALLQTGEYVLSRNDMYNIKNGSAKGSSSVPAQPVKHEIVVVNSIDPSVVEQYIQSRAGREVIQNVVRR